MQANQSMPGPSHAGSASAGMSLVPLFHAAWLFALGILLARLHWLQPAWLLLALVPVAVLCWMAAVRAPRVAWLPLAVLWCLLGAWCAEMQPQPAPAAGVAALSDNLLRSVEGTVLDAGAVRRETVQSDDRPATDETTQRIDLRVSSMEVVNDAEDVQQPVTGGVRLIVHWPQDSAATAFRCGERVRADVRLLPPQVYRDAGVWSRADYLLDQGITATGSVRIQRIVDLGPAPGVNVPCRIAELQHAASARLMALPAAMHRWPTPLRLDEDDVAMLAAMTTGDRTYLTHPLRLGFERTGSFHMLVVSGLHLAIVAGCLFWMARRLRIPEMPATMVTLAASLAYALFTGFAAPVQRSLWMIAVYLLGRLVYRQRNGLNAIGFAALCLLAASPRSLFDAGLQMTLLAVVAIAGVAAPLLKGTVHVYLGAMRDLGLVAIDVHLPPRLAQFRVVLRMAALRLQRTAGARIGWRVFPWTVRFALRCVELVVVTLVVELAMTLPMALYFHRITLFALPVNLLVVPLLVVLMPAALLLLALLVAWPWAALAPALLVALLLHSGVGLVHLFGRLQWSDLRVATPAAWQSAVFCALLAAAIALALRAQATGARWPWRAAWVAMVLAALAAVAPRTVEHPANALLVEAIDVGQGDSLLLIAPDGRTMLVDGGGPAGGVPQGAQQFDIGEEVVSAALWARGIRRLDVVALSHAHSDHMGGLPAVLRNFHPRELWVGNNPPVADYTALLRLADDLQVRVRSLRAGDALTLGDTQVSVLAPMPDYQPGAEPENDDSLVLRVAYGATSVLLEGDAEAPEERAMLAERGLRSNLLKVGHHGSDTSTGAEFLARVAPQWAAISCGLHNRYGHPREETLARLQAAHVRTYSTDVGGATCFLLNGSTVTAEPLCQPGRP